MSVNEEDSTAAEEFERSANWLRGQLRGFAAVVTRGAEPEAEEWIKERLTTRGAMGRQFTMRVNLPDAPASPAAALAMVFKLVESAQARWRAIIGAQLVPLVRAGAQFENGLLVERTESHAA